MAVILYSPASPYSAKVRMAAQWCGVEAESRVVDTGSQPAELVAANPLGKIPVLIDDDGEAVFDSRAITQHLNRVSGGALFPRKADKRLRAERLEALADGICDCLLAHVYERRMRPAERSTSHGSTRNGPRRCAASTIWKPTCRSWEGRQMAGRSRCAPRSAIWRCASTASGSAAGRS